MQSSAGAIRQAGALSLRAGPINYPQWRQPSTVTERYPTDPATYGVKDYGGEGIKGKFYAQELQKVTKEDDVYEIEEVVKTRKRAGKVEYFVKWKGYPSKFNSWVDAVTTK